MSKEFIPPDPDAIARRPDTYYNPCVDGHSEDTFWFDDLGKQYECECCTRCGQRIMKWTYDDNERSAPDK